MIIYNIIFVCVELYEYVTVWGDLVPVWVYGQMGGWVHADFYILVYGRMGQGTERLPEYGKAPKKIEGDLGCCHSLRTGRTRHQITESGTPRSLDIGPQIVDQIRHGEGVHRQRPYGVGGGLDPFRSAPEETSNSRMGG